MFTTKDNTGDPEQGIGMFELPARCMLLETKKAIKHNRELAQLCDKLDDLLSSAGTLTRLMLQYTQSYLPDCKTEEAQEYEKFRTSVDFETFRLIKYIVLIHLQRTECASQLIDLLENEPDKAKKAAIIHTALEIALNQEEYTLPRNIDTSMLRPPISMTADEFRKANSKYDHLLKMLDRCMRHSDCEDSERYMRLAEIIDQSSYSRVEKTMLFVQAWSSERIRRFITPLRDPASDLPSLQRIETDIDEFFDTLHIDEPIAFADDASPAETDAASNGEIEERLQRLLQKDETHNGGNEG